MEMAFSRGLYPGWLGGINNQKLVHARFGKKRGVYLGEVARVLREVVAASASCALRTRGSLSCPLVRTPKMDTPKAFSPTGALWSPALNNCFDLNGSVTGDMGCFGLAFYG